MRWRSRSRRARDALAHALARRRRGAPVAAPTPARGDIGGCVESVPQGAQRPDRRARRSPTRGTSGYAATLVDHRAPRQGRDACCRAGLELQARGEAAKELKQGGLRDPRSGRRRGGAALRREPDPSARRSRHDDARASARRRCRTKPGRHVLVAAAAADRGRARERRDRDACARTPHHDRRRGSDRERRRTRSRS